MHQLELFTDGTAAFASRLDAWHRLGTITGECMTGEQVMDKAKLGGWNVRKLPLTATEITADGVTTLEVPDKYATVRTHPVTGATAYLGTVGNDYTVRQNEEQIELLDALVEASGAKHFETAGSLRGGTQTFVTMRMPQTMHIGGIDDIDLYIAVLNSHDGSSAVRVMITPVRVVCANTQHMAIKGALASHSIRHTKHSKIRIAQIRQKLGLMWEYAEAFERETEKLINAELSTMQFKQIIGQLWPIDENETSVRTRNNHDRRTGRLLYLWEHAATQTNIRGTRWAGLQAVTEYLDHYTPAKNDMVRAHRVLTGASLTDYKQQAYELLTV
jgi:phage/plasmid-like protein (TIGR03299 family)